MKIVTRFLFPLLLFFCSLPGTCSDPGFRFYLLEDSARILDANAALQLYHQGRFEPRPTGEYNPGFTRSVYWLAVSADSTIHPSNYRLVIGNPHINKLHFYTVQGGQVTEKYQAGDHFPFAQRPVPTTRFSFPLSDSARCWLVRVDKHNESLQLSFTTMTADQLALKESDDAITTGILSGIIVLLLVFGIYLAAISRKRVYLLYIFYVAAGWLWVLSDLGFGFKYLWPDNAWFASRARPVFSSLSIILSIQYLVYYMGGLESDWLKRLLKLTTIIASGMLLLWFIPMDPAEAPALTWIMLKLIPAVTAVYVMLGLAALFSGARKKNKMALFYLAALIPLMIMVVVNLMNHSGVIDITGSWLEQYGVAVGYVTEVVILTFGLAYSFNSHRLEKERLQLRYALQQKENAKALIDTEARERRRIADELHDIAGSMLSAAKLNITSVREKSAFADHETRLRLQKAEEALTLVSNSVRSLSHALSPIMLNRFGLKKSIETAASFFSSSGKIQVEVVVIGFENHEPALEDIYTMLYSISYEFLNNAVKHADASWVMLQLVEHDDSISLMVEDNGKGLQNIDSQPSKGLAGIISKINYFNGTIAFDNTKTGLVISIDIPKLNYEKTGSTGR